MRVVRRRVRGRGWSLAAWGWMLAAAAAAAAAIWFTTGWLLDTTRQAIDQDLKATGADRARIRVEAVRTGLAAGAGAGAAVGLMLAFRRQAHTEHDTAERRVTELYNAAAEQLGSAAAPVRLTALYTLERLANDNPRHRQTIVNIICAYLRMPFTPPPRPDTPESERAHRAQAQRHLVRYRSARAGQPALVEPLAPDPHEELQVRLTAQRILKTHLHRKADRRWRGLSLDLTGAVLINFEFSECAIDQATFTRATFSGDAWFDGATFARGVWFDGATFTGNAGFVEATFTGYASFHGATFTGYASFVEAAFAWLTGFNRATFAGVAWFNRTTFTGNARLEGATVADVGREHVLPPGWRIEPAEGTRGRVVPDPAPSEGA
ncbi:pentapeptide repeat-containing protein [Actinomadura sp. 21ATH]|uniref:pentapeptide repeat-containing protein n=1 Tax=Actinomadura sp. 21ATH TaxID=1735444 RepID=UPI0035C07FEC